MEILSKIHTKNLVEWAKDKEDVYVLSADLTSSCEADLFRDTYPERFLSMGIAEQNMLSFAGGMAREGLVPLVHTFAVFIYRRAYDQISMSIAYPNLPVKMFGFLPGITTPGGATHQAIEDISVMRSLPNMTIIECGDATDAESILDVAYSVDGPVYIRMLRGEIPRLFDKSEPMKFNQPRLLSEGNDIVILSSGICTEEAMRAIAEIQKKGVSVCHYHISTLKPFNTEAVIEDIKNSKYGVITIENHSVVGGLGSIVSEAVAEYGLNQKVVKIGLKDTFAHGGSKQYLMKYYSIDAMKLIEEVEALIGKKLFIEESSLSKVHITPVHSLSKAEAL